MQRSDWLIALALCCSQNGTITYDRVRRCVEEDRAVLVQIGKNHASISVPILNTVEALIIVTFLPYATYIGPR